MSEAKSITVKCTFENDTRRRVYASTVSFADLRASVADSYALSNVVLKYTDEDNDVITLGSDVELQEAFAIANKQKNGVVRVVVFRADDSKETQPAAAPVVAERAVSQPVVRAQEEGQKILSDDDDDEDDVAESVSSNPLAALRTFLAGVGQQAESGANVRAFLERVGGQLATHSAGAAAAANAQIRAAVDALLARGVVTRDAVQELSDAIAESPRAVQELVLSLVALAQTQAEAVDAAVRAAASAVTAPAPAAVLGTRHSATCDVCMAAIVGVRYKCANCADYDLCSACEANNASGRLHDRTHVFLKLTLPVPAGVGALLPNLYGSRGRPVPTAMAARRCAAGAAGEQALEARFVRDCTIADGSVLQPRTPFCKIWTLRNSASAPWPAGCRLTHVGGDLFPGTATASDALPAVAPDTEVSVAVDMIAPDRAGRYASFWRLTTPSGQRFGHRVWVSIHVDDEQRVEAPVAAVVSAAVAPVAAPAPVDAAAVDGAAKAADAEDEAMLTHIERSFHKLEPAPASSVVAEQSAPVTAADAAPAQAPVTAVAAVEPVVDLFASQSRQLANMGFADAARNRSVLERHSGDVLAAVQELLADH